MPGAAVFGVDHLQIVLLQDAGQGEDVADVVVHDQHLLAGQGGIAAAEVSRIWRCASERSASGRCSSSTVSSSRRSMVIHEADGAQARETHDVRFDLDSPLGSVQNDGRRVGRGRGLDFLDQLSMRACRPGRDRSAMPSSRVVADRRQGLSAERRPGKSRRPGPPKRFVPAVHGGSSRPDTISRCRARACERTLDPSKAALSVSLVMDFSR